MQRLPPLARTALLLDLDGTLVDIAPAPDLVVVPPGLIESLRQLRAALGSALAIISGRPVETVDALLRDIPFAVAGEHGGAVRHAPGAPVCRPGHPPPPDSWLTEAERLAAAWPGTLVEHKSRGFALHFRAVPEAGPALRAALAALVASDPGFHLLQGHMVWEVRPQGADKGKAVGELMACTPFSGRLPLFIGDDVTDEDAIRMARSMGGAGLRVDDAFGDPDGVRAWLAGAAKTGDWPPLPRGS